MTDKTNSDIIQEQIQTVYDPEFPIVDIRTLGLIYGIDCDDEEEKITITMTYTTPACPDGELMQQMTINAIHERFPTYDVVIDLTFDPVRKLDMIKDPDLLRMFM
ncbi:MAG: DUF59 domain-containing protein [Candidatus Peribacteria bacterium]|nr:MAG: DUF59 domain-containing protein [Candidatus Peribacteria bacterium]